VIDALRADFLSCYGNKDEITPNLDKLAEEGVLFKNCYTQASWTKPSVASILTSLYPTMHGANLHGDILPDEVTTISEILKKEGYLTYGYVANPNLKRLFNFDQGFDFYDDYLMRDKLYYATFRNLKKKIPFLEKIIKKDFNYWERDNIRLANKRIIPWLKHYKEKNFFAFIHYMDPHSDYRPPPPFNKMFPYDKDDENSKNISLYKGEICFVDHYLGRLFNILKLLKIYEKSLIIITSDHGDAFGEHKDYEHGNTIYQEQIKVPLIIKFPYSKFAGKVINSQVRSIDILPTILDFLNIKPTNNLEGRSLLPLLEDPYLNICNEVYIDHNLDDRIILKGIIKDNRWKYIYTIKSDKRDIKKLGFEELYNLKEDPKELNNLVNKRPNILNYLRNKLAYYQKYCTSKAFTAPKAKLDKQTIKQLKALGYLQ
jgi:arylsulfatase A-like enzyme